MVRRLVGLVALVVTVVAACTPNPGSPAGTTSTTATTVPPLTSRIYMTDHVRLSAVDAETDQVAVSMRLGVLGCSDVDSCASGVRRSDGYTWFAALAVDVGPDATSSEIYGMHGGLAFGGSGRRSRMYLDWSGYCPASRGGGPLRFGGSSCAVPNANPTQQPHTVVDLDPARWYRITVRRVTCDVSDTTDVPGVLTGWQLVLVDQTTSIEQSGGTWCLPRADVIAEASLFTEVIEPRGPCVTDFGSLEMKDMAFHGPGGWTPFAHASGHYNGNETPADADCGDTNLRLVAPGHVVDERMVPRGSNGGLTGPGFQSLY